MVAQRPSGVPKRSRRRWSFGDCSFDEANWSLTVKGDEIRIERKPLEVLRQLLVHAGEVVSKDQLLDSVWPEVTVVEASLTTAVRKLRVAIGDGDEGHRFIQAVPGIGYRIGVPVFVEEMAERPATNITTTSAARSGERAGPAEPRRTTRLAPLWAAGGLVAVIAALWTLGLFPKFYSPAATRTFSSREVATVMRRLDVEEAEKMIAAGWNPDAALDAAGDTPLGFAVEICEWDRGHDRRRLVLMARTLIDGGARVDHRNMFGDTPYSIARAKRFCGADHPVTEMFRMICSSGAAPLGDRCMASYELARGQHFVPLPKPAS